jgi:hypothetical protein
MRRPGGFLWWSWAQRLFEPVARLLFPPFRRHGRAQPRPRTMPQLTVLECRRAPGSVLAWFHRLDDTEQQPAVVQEPPPPSDYSQRDLAWASSSKGSAFDLTPAVQQSDSKEDTPSDTAHPFDTGLDYRLASFALGAPDLLDDLTQPPWRSRGLALAGATGAMSSGDGGGAAAPALAGQGAAALGMPAGAFGGGSDNS